jgi:hypothetical protein
MIDTLNNSPVTTILSVIVTTVIVGVGGAIAILHPETLTFSAYVKDVGIGVGGSVTGLGVLGIARSQAGKG